jgi:hypothetical protein
MSVEVLFIVIHRLLEVSWVWIWSLILVVRSGEVLGGVVCCIMCCFGFVMFYWSNRGRGVLVILVVIFRCMCEGQEFIGC